MPLEIIRASEKDVDRVAPLFDQYREFYKERADAEGARSFLMERLWILNDLFVSPGARKRGVGVALLQRAEEFARQTNAKGLELETWVNNIPAQHLYEKCGWKRNVEFYQYTLYLS